MVYPMCWGAARALPGLRGIANSVMAMSWGMSFTWCLNARHSNTSGKILPHYLAPELTPCSSLCGKRTSSLSLASSWSVLSSYAKGVVASRRLFRTNYGILCFGEQLHAGGGRTNHWCVAGSSFFLRPARRFRLFCLSFSCTCMEVGTPCGPLEGSATWFPVDISPL